MTVRELKEWAARYPDDWEVEFLNIDPETGSDVWFPYGYNEDWWSGAEGQIRAVKPNCGPTNG